MKVIKVGEAPSMQRDVQVLQWLKGKFPVAEVLYYTKEGDYEYLLTSEIEGDDAIYPDFTNNPEKMVRILGESLRKLHSIDSKDCPFDKKFEERVEDFKSLVQAKK